MPSLELPQDLAAFLAAGKQLEYDSSDCETGKVTLLPLAELRLELFPVDCQGMPVARQDPNHGSRGCYLVPGVSLLATAEGYDPEGLLLWLPREHRYGGWDGSHDGLSVYAETTTWTDIVREPAEHIDANWHSWDSLMECPEPWHRCRRYHEQLHWPVVPVRSPGVDAFRVVTYQGTLQRRGGAVHGRVLGFPEVTAVADTLEGGRRALRVALAEKVAAYLSAERPLPQPRLANNDDFPWDEYTTFPVALEPE
jgi:hypothetical protein